MTTDRSPSDVRILLVDDDPDQRLVAIGLLAQRGFRHVTEADGADAAVRIASTIEPDLILLDLVMPGRSGADVLPDLRLAAPTALIVVLSNMSRRRLLEPMLRRGAVGFVEKSVSADRFVDEILIAAALTEMARMHVLNLSATAGAARVARRFARERLNTADAQLIADIELLISELINNAVVHANSEPRLEIHVSPARVRVEVYDDVPDLPTAREPDLDEQGGRGLHMISSLASRWGAEPAGTGKAMWFEIDHAPGP